MPGGPPPSAGSTAAIPTLGAPTARTRARRVPAAQGAAPPRADSGERPTRLESYLAKVAPETVGVTFWFEPPAEATPSDRLVVQVAGRRRNSSQKGAGLDRFDHEEAVEGLVGGSGPVAVTSRVSAVEPGDWDVSAQAFLERCEGGGGPAARQRIEVHQARWSPLRWSPQPAAPSLVRTCMLPLAMAPGTLLGAWALLAVTGITLALFVQGWVASARNLAVPHLLVVSLGAVTGGVIGAKAWYMVVHRREHRRDGWCIQGLVTGVTVVGVGLVAAAGLPIGEFLDVTIPGLLFGMAIGRVGCFFGGCCYGQPTSSRWGVWSSDRRIGARRIPTQLLECLLAVSTGAAALAGSLSESPMRGGVFVAALGGYTVIRQRLLRWRAEPRQSTWMSSGATLGAGTMIAVGIAIAAA